MTYKHVQEEVRVARVQRERYLKQFAVGTPWVFLPRNTAHPHHAQVVRVVRAPRAGVKHPSVRVQPPEGKPFSVSPGVLQRPEGITYKDRPRTDTTPILADARKRPAWKRLVNLYTELFDAETAQRAVPDDAGEATHHAAATRVSELQATVTHRAQQLAGMTAPRGTDALARTHLVQDLERAARLAALEQLGHRARRNGHPVTPTVLPEGTFVPNVARLDRHQRHMINRIALSLHRRYFLSDKELRALTEQEREQQGIQRVMGQIIREEQKRTGMSDASSDVGKGSRLHGDLEDHLTAANRLALEACRLLDAGHLDEARTLAHQVQDHRAKYLQVNAELDRARVKHHTGRFFHGDILSVREEHVELDEEGEFQAYAGMTQYYVRLVIVYAPDGHSVIVANHRELAALTGHRVQPSAWASLCRWIEDTSERRDGRRRGRRQDDDEHLIYQEHDGSLELRPTLKRYPDLLQAFECIRAALGCALPAQDIQWTELPPEAPEPGFHAPPLPEPRKEGGDLTKCP